MATMDSASFSAEAAEAALPMYKQILRMEFIDEMLANTTDESTVYVGARFRVTAHHRIVRPLRC